MENTNQLKHSSQFKKFSTIFLHHLHIQPNTVSLILSSPIMLLCIQKTLILIKYLLFCGLFIISHFFGTLTTPTYSPASSFHLLQVWLTLVLIFDSSIYLLNLFFIYKTIMQSKTFLLAFLLLAIVSAQKTLNVTCSTCTQSQCASGYCFKLLGASLSETVCLAVGKTCNLALVNVQYSVNNCTYDYGSVPCSTGICFSIPNKKIALLGGTCGTQYNQNITCGTCVGQACSSNICQVMTKGTNASVTSCVDGCANPANTNMVISTCTAGFDDVGNQNGCCITFQGTGGAVCSTQSTVLTGSTSLRAWIKGTSGNFGAHLNSVFIAILFILATFLF